MIKDYENKAGQASGQGVNSDYKRRVVDALFDFHRSRKSRNKKSKTRKTRRKSFDPVRLGDLLPGMITCIEQRQPELTRQKRSRSSQDQRSLFDPTDDTPSTNENSSGLHKGFRNGQ